jgi:hypothetical protein
MSKTTADSTDEPSSTETEAEPTPACETNLTGNGTEWDTKDAAVFPPGYPRLCSDPNCFGEQFDEYAEKGDRRLPGYDHTEDLDEFVLTTGSNNTSQRLHRPASEVDDAE